MANETNNHAQWRYPVTGLLLLFGAAMLTAACRLDPECRGPGCRPECTSASCDFECAEGTCIIECNDVTRCGVTCEAGTECSIDGGGATSVEVVCAAGSKCLIHCGGV